MTEKAVAKLEGELGKSGATFQNKEVPRRGVKNIKCYILSRGRQASIHIIVHLMWNSCHGGSRSQIAVG